MIISHKYKFIFIKTAKTAGTSIEIALSRFCGKDDILTPISWNDERMRKALGYRSPQHYAASARQYRFKDVVQLLSRRRWKRRFYNHISGQEVRRQVGEQIWSEYFKFCFERNPWDRVVSLYYYVHRSEPRPTLTSFVNSDAPLILKRRGSDLYTYAGNVIVDRIFAFESLADDLDTVAETLSLPEQLKLPEAKSGFRQDKRAYRELMNSADRDRIRLLFDDEIARFGYEF